MDERVLLKLNTFKKFALDIATLSVSQTKKVGCICFKKDFTKIASFGYNGGYKGAPINNLTQGEELSLAPGESGFIHAEINMIAKFREINPDDYIVLCTLSPCYQCMITLINSDFKNIFWIESYRETKHLKILQDQNINHGDMTDLYNYLIYERRNDV